MKHKQLLKENSSVMDLHESILVKILIFLPIQCIIRCRCVCKNWATLISSPYFIETYDHSTKKSAPIQLLIEDRYLRMKTNNLLFLHLDDVAFTAIDSPADYAVAKKTRFSLEFLDYVPDSSSYMLKVFSTCSVTGCIAACIYNGEANTPVIISCHIFNPVTGQHILVDDNTNSYRLPLQSCALLYAQKTNQFKFLYFHPRVSSMEVKVSIQTIGTNSWRRRGRIPIYPTQQTLPTYINGLYHWIDSKQHIIYSFNADQEVFQQIKTPSGIKSFLSSNLGRLDDCLCICVKSYSFIELWVMSGDCDGNSWTKKFVVYNLEIANPYRIAQPLKCLPNGEIVLLYPRYAICYNPTTGSRKQIRFDDRASTRYRPFPFIPSLKNMLP